MWPYRRKPAIIINNNNNNNDDDCSPRSRRALASPNFKHRSFKDIETLTHDDDNNDNDTIKQQQEPQPSRPTIFHRIHLANRFSRAFFSRNKPEPEDDDDGLKKPVPGSDKPANFEKLVPGSDKPANFEKLVPGSQKPAKLEKLVPGSDKRVVVYLTSLRAVRPTFEACRTVRSILHGFRVPIDERDLLMDSSFYDEIRKIMAQIGQGRREEKRVSLPKVFIGGRYIGGVDEVVELHEIGELKKFMTGLPAAPPGVCEVCGGFRFVLCEECNGSHKCPLEDGGFSACVVCNENGLIRCPSCLNC